MTQSLVAQLAVQAQTLSVDEMLALNKALCNMIKSKRRVQQAVVGADLQPGQIVRFGAKTKHYPPIRPKAEVDLLWFGGIGTYVKASFETHAQVGDKAGDAFRVNGNELRCKVLAEGGNLGCTQNGRIEYAQKGGLA